jgi:hypothetical protein
LEKSGILLVSSDSSKVISQASFERVFVWNGTTTGALQRQISMGLGEDLTPPVVDFDGEN